MERPWINVSTEKKSFWDDISSSCFQSQIFFFKSVSQHTRQYKQSKPFGWWSYHQASLRTLKIEVLDVLKNAWRWVNQPKSLTCFILSFMLHVAELENKMYLQRQALLLAKQEQGYMATWNFKENLVLEWRNNNPWLH